MRTKIFLVGFFLPSWIASLLMWGDARTSVDFVAAPGWFFPVQMLVQALAISMLFIPPSVRSRPALTGLFFSLTLVIALHFSEPIIEAERLLITGSILISIVAVLLCIFRPTALLTDSDMGFVYYLFIGGFALQVFLYFQYGIVPSHSIEEVFIRFNGITNDSLSTAFILPCLVPWAVTSRFALPKLLALNAAAFITGSMFAIVMIPLLTIILLIRNRDVKALTAMTVAIIAAAIIFYDEISRIFTLKILSIITHLSFFLNLSGQSVYKSVSCSEEFCESFVQAGSHLSIVYVGAFYGLLLVFLVPLFRQRAGHTVASSSRRSVTTLGCVILVGSLVHPVPILPNVVPFFLILAALVITPGEGRTVPLPESRRPQGQGAALT